MNLLNALLLTTYDIAMINLTIQNNRISPILGRHPWLFSRGVLNLPDGIESGEPVKLFDQNKRFLAQGYFNSYSQIAVRIWSYEENEEINDAFFITRITKALALRKQYLASKLTDSFRLFNSENEGLPGLVVDKYADYLVVQFHTRGIETWKPQILDALIKIVKPKGIFEKTYVSEARMEKPENPTGLLYGELPEKIIIKENGLRFYVDVRAGQKTGFFLDQRDKRAAVGRFSDGKTVLNCFAYTGGFSVYALAGGAKEVTSVEISEGALDAARENIKLNKFDLKKCHFECADVKDYLRNAPTDKFDLIVLDPPAFIKNRDKVREGIGGYKKINEVAIRLIKQPGILVTCSCSAHLPIQDFRFLLAEAAGYAKKSAQILETYTHGLDHPELVAFTEGDYLKCFILQIQQ